ncbi:hypothetical protein ACFX2I_016149 [Malus domestica]
MKRRRRDKDVNKNVHAIDDEKDPEAWIENELENGVELKATLKANAQSVINDHFMVTVSFADVEVHSYTRATLEKAWALINLACSYVAIESSN